MAVIDREYKAIADEILSEGYEYLDRRRRIVCKQISDYHLVYNLDNGFPLLTTKKMYYKGIIAELLWFIKGDTNIKYLIDNGVNIWNKDALNYCIRQTGEKLTMESFLEGVRENKTKKLWNGEEYLYGDLGPVYGAQWRKNTDQLSSIIFFLRCYPENRRSIVNSWNPDDLGDMALPPCHWSYEIISRPIGFSEEYIKGYGFDLKWNQRSADFFLGIPYNIASYATLAKIIGLLTDMKPLRIIGNLSNIHIYKPHINLVKEQISRDTDKYGIENPVELKISDRATKILQSRDLIIKDKLDLIGVEDGINVDDFEIINYEGFPAIRGEMYAPVSQLQ